MSINTSRVDRSFSTTEIQDLTTAFQSVDTIFDFHRGVSPADASRMLRIGTNNRLFVQEVKTAANDFPWVLPGYISSPQLDAGYDLWFQLDSMEAYLESLLSRVSQTKLVVGNHLMHDCLDIYGNMQKAVGRGVSGVITYLNAAERRFENNGGSPQEDDGPGGPGAGSGGSDGPNSSGGSGSGNQGGNQSGDSQDNSGGQGGTVTGQGMQSDNDPAPTSGNTQNGGNQNGGSLGNS